jgi:regulator of RNase E activity RraA
MTQGGDTYMISDENYRKLHHISTATLTTQLLKRGFRNTFIAGLTPLRPDLRMVGRAFTLRYVPIREDLDKAVEYDNNNNIQRLAVEEIGEGDVLVIDARSNVNAASFGHILATRIMMRGASGFVTDGALRDTVGIQKLDLPVYTRMPHATTSVAVHHPVDMNVPIGCGEVYVQPGDIVVGDAEGVVIMPESVANEVAHDGYEQERLEQFLQQKVAQGSSIKGVYPPNAEMLADYKIWQSEQTD